MHLGIFTVLTLISITLGDLIPTGKCKLNKNAALMKLLKDISRFEEMYTLQQAEENNESGAKNLTKKQQEQNYSSNEHRAELEEGFEAKNYFSNENECETEDLRELDESEIDDACTRMNTHERIRKATVQCINKYRRLHRVSPLKISRIITKKAQAWADRLVHQHSLSHSPNKKYGENVWSFNGSKAPKPEAPCKTWYSEAKKFHFGTESIQGSGHFTQIVWKASKEIGVGVANKRGKWIVVADFYPPGNVRGHVVANVKPKVH